MKKICVAVICFLFLAASFFYVGGISTNSWKTVFAADVSEPTTVPSGISFSYSNSEDGANSIGINSYVGDCIKYHGNFGALYNSTGYLYIWVNYESEEMVSIQNVQVIRLGASSGGNFEGDDDLSIDIEEDYDEERDRAVYFWKYSAFDSSGNELRAVGKYKIIVSAWILSEPEEPEIGEPNEPEGGEPEEPEDFEVDIVNFVFYSTCKSADVPAFGASYYYDGTTYDNTTRFYSSLKSPLLVSAAPDSKYSWGKADATYATTDEKLTVSQDGKFLYLKIQPAGTYTINFTVYYSFLNVNEDGTFTVVSKTEEISQSVTFLIGGSSTSIWEVLLGIVVLGALGGAAYFLTKLSKNVENR